MEAAQQALAAGENQYARSMGHPDLVEAVAEHVKDNYGLKIKPYEEVCIFGCDRRHCGIFIGLS